MDLKEVFLDKNPRIFVCKISKVLSVVVSENFLELRFRRLVFYRYFNGTASNKDPCSALGAAEDGRMPEVFLVAGSIAPGLDLPWLFALVDTGLVLPELDQELLPKVGLAILEEDFLFLFSSANLPFAVSALCTVALKNGSGCFHDNLTWQI